MCGPSHCRRTKKVNPFHSRKKNLSTNEETPKGNEWPPEQFRMINDFSTSRPRPTLFDNESSYVVEYAYGRRCEVILDVYELPVRARHVHLNWLSISRKAGKHVMPVLNLRSALTHWKKLLFVLPGSGVMAGSGVSNSGNIVVIIITWEISLTETAFPCKTSNAGSGWKVSEWVSRLLMMISAMQSKQPTVRNGEVYPSRIWFRSFYKR